MKTGIYSFQLSARGRLQTLSCLGTSRLTQEHEFRVRQFPGDSMKKGCMPGNPLFASHSLPQTKECVQNGADNIRTGHSFNGLMFSSPMSPDSIYNLILDYYWYAGNLEHDTIPATLSKVTIMLVGDSWFLLTPLLTACILIVHLSVCRGWPCTILEATHTVQTSILLSSFIFKFRLHWIYWQ